MHITTACRYDRDHEVVNDMIGMNENEAYGHHVTCNTISVKQEEYEIVVKDFEAENNYVTVSATHAK